ncbi:hypothetical protein [Sinomonas terrae]|uniref:Integral membrane protein n=1 Tax=Sinomonas terrae TaxID=2908838 RepID=A0ABS9TVQ0_9MICC|nr:hypothetical protein [Sinomonas terrae]MCH6468501.1 hypothetical protein [Sinomonas terrae]
MIVLASIVALWLLVLSRLPSCIRQRGDLVFFVALPAALATTISYPAVFRSVDSSLGLPGMASLMSGCLIMLSFGLFRTAIVKAVVAPEEQEPVLRRGLLQTTAAMTVYCVAFACASTAGAVTVDQHLSRPAFDAVSQSDVGVFVFMATLCAFLAAVSVEVTIVCLRYLPQMASAMFRTGFTSVALGCVITVVAFAAKFLRQLIVLTFVGLDYEPFLQNAFQALEGTAALLLSFGLMLPSISERVAQWQLYERYHLLRLHPVWRRTAHAGVVIDSVSVPLKGVLGRNPRARLHRTLVEILDSNLAAGGNLLSESESKLVKKSEGALYA